VHTIIRIISSKNISLHTYIRTYFVLYCAYSYDKYCHRYIDANIIFSQIKIPTYNIGKLKKHTYMITYMFTLTCNNKHIMLALILALIFQHTILTTYQHYKNKQIHTYYSNSYTYIDNL
jgi:hypothetical protein